MKKILATVIKEWILTRRDVAGFMLLFLMPAILIVVMALVQDAPFKDYQKLKFNLLVADNDNGSIADSIKNGLRQSGSFTVTETIHGLAVTEEQLKQLLENGDYSVGIVIPKGTTAEMVNSANMVANSISEKIGMGAMPVREPRDSMFIRMYFDPVSKPTFRMSVGFALDKLVTAASTHVLVQRLSEMGAPDSTDTTITPVPGTGNIEHVLKGLAIREEKLSDKTEHSKYMNSVQHNVPAWAIFGMFFIVIPICSHLIREREEGSALRIELIPGARRMVALGKILFYTIVCTVQFALMFCVGIWLLPLLGLPSLYLGANAWALAPVAIAIAIAATSYGYFIGVMFKTTNQAMPFGAISVVMLSALGGIWVPVEIFSPLLQKFAMISPLYWGLDGINQVTLRNGDITDILPHILVLTLFSAMLWAISTYRNMHRNHSVQ